MLETLNQRWCPFTQEMSKTGKQVWRDGTRAFSIVCAPRHDENVLVFAGKAV